MSLGDSFSESIWFDPRPSKIRSSHEVKQSHDFLPAVVLLLLTGSFLFLLAALIRLQIFQGAYYREISSNNRTREDPIHAPRGSIFDRNGILLAGSDGAYRLKKCELSGSCKSSILSREDGLKAEADGLPKNSFLEIDSQRFYTKGESFGSILGYVSEISEEELAKNKKYNLGDRIGRGGLEQQYEQTLRGIDGHELIEVDAMGKKIRSLGKIDPQSGQELRLTIDSNLQMASYKALEGRKGALVASNPMTGEILALVSSPSFDPNVFTLLTTDNETRNKKITQLFNDRDQPLFDRAVSATYPPGSTYKIVSAIAGLETGGINAKTTIDDPGILVIGQYKFPNWKYLRDGGTQGVLSVVQALQKSNDIFFYRVGEWTGEEKLFSWSKTLGLGRKTGIDLPGEAIGVVPDASWRKANRREYFLGDIYHAAIGQGDFLVTPLQVNMWTNVIANRGKLCSPYLNQNLKTIRSTCQSLSIKDSNIDLVVQGMIAACSDGGTAYPLFNFTNGKNEKLQIACKTGTAEFGDPANRTHAWLTAYAPAQNPQISVTAIVEASGEGSDVAAPVVKKVLGEWFGR